jgi:ribosomal-protein-alanine N-acetyltransferase
MAFKDKFIAFQNLVVTDAIALRQVDPLRDAAAYFAILSDTDAFQYYEGSGLPPKTVDDVAMGLQNHNKKFKSAYAYIWTITERATDTAIGEIHLSLFQNNNTAANIGYYLQRDRWRHGIMTACVNTVVRFGFDNLQLERIFTTVMPENVGSWKVLERNGFLREGTLRHCFQVKSGLQDCYIYAKLSTD